MTRLDKEGVAWVPSEPPRNSDGHRQPGSLDRPAQDATPPVSAPSRSSDEGSEPGTLHRPARVAMPPKDREAPPAEPARPGLGRRRGLVLALVALLLVLPVAGFAWFLKAVTAPPMTPLRHTDGIAVLTGGGERVETGLRLLLQGRAARLLVSGVHRDATLADLARGAALPPEALAGRVTLGHAATTTRGNAAEIAAWARAEGLHSIRIVTAGYHMPRALLELRRALPEAEFVPHPVVPARLRDAGAVAQLRTWSLLAGEYLKLIGAWAGLTRLRDGPLEPR